MSAIDSLLGPRPGPLPDTADQPRTLLLDDDVMVHLQEDESREHVVVYSIPGRMEEVDWLMERTEPWCHVLRHPAYADASAMLSADPATRDVFLAEKWPRAVLDRVTFGKVLSQHVEHHRVWRSMLLPGVPL
jgi:hypothetical protein